ncbi:MAG: iron donor protein CyaY [Proteobacteria bacterium]|nr:iron donor protein CyaY [Pseudomonadota bacterium]
MHKAIALKYLSDLSDLLESGYDVDHSQDALLINHAKGQFLLNYHGVMDQIWLSSPLSGAHHFAYQDNQWLCTRTGSALEDILRHDLDA